MKIRNEMKDIKVIERSRNPGYKQTEVGLIPEDWETIKIGDSLLFKNGLNKASEFFGYGTPIINYMDVFKNFGLTKSDIKGKVFLNSQELNNFSARKGDVFFTRTSETQEEIGVSAVLLENIDNCVFSGFVLRGRPINNKVTSEYFQYCFIPDYVRTQIIAKSSFTTRALTNGRYLCNVNIALPPTLAEQKAIATALSDVDDLMRRLDELIAKKKAIKQGAMQQLLTPPSKGGKRLDGFDGEWVEKSLGEICLNISSGKSDTDSTSGVFPIYGSTGRIGIKNYFDYQGERILVARVGANAGTLYTVKGEYCVSDNTLIVELKNNISLMFIYYSLKLYDITQLIFGSGQPLVTGGQLKDIELSIPKIEEQNTIAEVISDMDQELEELATKKEKYEHIKQGMMQELLTGKTRLV